MVKGLNRMYRREPALHQVDDSYEGFEWIDFRDVESSIISFLRFAKDRNDFLVIVCNFTPVPRNNYRIGVPHGGTYLEIFNTDADMFGGSNMGNGGHVFAADTASHGRPASLNITLPPLGVVVFKPA
jgi:1,4-alpha-glucan branching enzyme